MVICSTPLTCMSSASSPFSLTTTSLPPSPVPFLPSSPTCPVVPVTAFSISPTVSFPFFNTLPPSGIIIQPSSWKQSYGMEQVWQSEFNRLFSSFYSHFWFLQPVDQPPISNKSLYTFIDSAKVRFCCDKCGYGWTSMKGRVAFWYDLLSPYFNQGFVTFKMYGQKCKRCGDDRYEQAMWYPEEVTKVLANLYNRVGQTFYGFNQLVIEKTRRSGKPRTPHNSELCQACSDGLCSDMK